jgi:anti-sigma B factor antagonist
MSTDFSTEVTETGDETVIHVRGEIDIATCERLRDAIEPHLGPEQNLVLDFSEVEFMDSSCLRVLLQARGTLTADGGSLILRNPSITARRLLTAAQAEHLLQADANEHPSSDSRRPTTSESRRRAEPPRARLALRVVARRQQPRRPGSSLLSSHVSCSRPSTPTPNRRSKHTPVTNLGAGVSGTEPSVTLSARPPAPRARRRGGSARR